eukprot:357204-Chlamydomonas_euryale.AAC.10
MKPNRSSQALLASSRGEPQDATRQPRRDPAVETRARPRSESNRGRADTRTILRDQMSQWRWLPLRNSNETGNW